MLRKLTLALVAAASLSAVALAPSAASAKPWGGGGWGLSSSSSSSSLRRLRHRLCGGYDDDGCFVARRVPTPYGYRLRVVNVCGY